MARAWHTQTGAKAPQVGPAQLTTDWPLQMVRDPFRDGAPIPPLVLRRWAGQHHQQLILLRRGQQPSARPELVPQVLDAVGAMLVVAPGDPADPVGRIAGDTGNHRSCEAPSQEPEEVPATALDWILRGSVPSREFVSAQMGFGVNMSCHASLSTTLWRDPVSEAIWRPCASKAWRCSPPSRRSSPASRSILPSPDLLPCLSANPMPLLVVPLRSPAPRWQSLARSGSDSANADALVDSRESS